MLCASKLYKMEVIIYHVYIKIIKPMVTNIAVLLSQFLHFAVFFLLFARVLFTRLHNLCASILDHFNTTQFSLLYHILLVTSLHCLSTPILITRVILIGTCEVGISETANGATTG